MVPSHSLSHVDIGNLLRVLLALSSKYDFSQLSIRMTCNACDLNPNALPNARLCYDFLNTGKCKRDAAGEVCRFRHLPPDHIDAIVDKIRNGKMPVCLIRQRGNQFLVACRSRESGGWKICLATTPRCPES